MNAIRILSPLAATLGVLVLAYGITGGSGAPPGFFLRIVVAAQTEAEAVENRLANVRRLLEDSSAARQVAAKGGKQAIEVRDQARDLYNRAEKRFRLEDFAGANVLLEKATRAMFEAVRLAGMPAVLEAKKHQDFESRAESVRALLEALERIGAEKGVQDQVAQTSANIQRLVGEARVLESSGSAADGRTALNAAYDLAKRSIEELRGGDTLVRSLHFDSKEEEYRYETDRNDTHQMLVKVLLEEKRKSQGVNRMVQTFIERATALRMDAEQFARSGDYEAAVGALEKSTRELMRAIRSAGVYIPG
jgi:tetratricopeptide (TPR) repeat protein